MTSQDTPSSSRTSLVRQRNKRNYRRMLRHSYFFTFVIPHDMDEAIRAAAKAKGIPLAELVRTYIEWGLENDQDRNPRRSLG